MDLSSCLVDRTSAAAVKVALFRSLFRGRDDVYPRHVGLPRGCLDDVRQTLTETKGRFGVNVALPIAFDGAGRLEVDLLCTNTRVWRQSWTGRSISRMPSRTDGTVARIGCSSRTATSYRLSLLKT